MSTNEVQSALADALSHAKALDDHADDAAQRHAPHPVPAGPAGGQGPASLHLPVLLYVRAAAGSWLGLTGSDDQSSQGAGQLPVVAAHALRALANGGSGGLVLQAVHFSNGAGGWAQGRSIELTLPSAIGEWMIVMSSYFDPTI